MSLLKRTVPLLMVLVLLNACSIQPVHTLDEQAALWQQHRLTVSQLESWSLLARVSIRNKDKAWSGKLHWRQQRDDYQIQFNAPFGQGAFQLVGEPGSVVMRLSDGQQFEAVNADDIIYEQLGWRLPVSALRYWVVGVPLPGSVPTIGLDDNGRLASLEQEHWRIHYPDYIRAGDVDLPRKVILENTGLNVRLVIDRWELSSEV